MREMTHETFWPAMFSSATTEWATPKSLFEKLNAEFHFDVDVCAREHNAKCERYFTPEMDGLAQEWKGVCWMNPPYGDEIGLWMAKAFHSANAGSARVVCLVPARTDTQWWHQYAMRSSEIRFVTGRIQFVGLSDNGAPFPSAIVIFDGFRGPRISSYAR